MRGGTGKDHARTAQPAIPVEGPRASGSGAAHIEPVAESSTARDKAASTSAVAQSTTTQPTDPDVQSSNSARTPSESVTGAYHDILVECNAIVEAYRKGEISKLAAYVEIQFKLVQALGDDRARTDAVFGSFIATIESHDTEVGAAVKKGRAIVPSQRSPSPLISDSDGNRSDEEPASKRTKVDESAYAWVSSRKNKRTDRKSVV